jgi:predicted DNA-binding transcriptional regulator AlpA
MSQLFLPAEVAALLRIEPRTLADWRYRGVGPPYIRLGGRDVRYRRSEIERFLADREHQNTAQEGGA